jgi:hypothetical protein
VLILWSWRWRICSAVIVCACTLAISFFVGVEGWETKELRVRICGPRHYIDSIDLLDSLLISSISATLLREKTDRIYTLFTITAFSIGGRLNFHHSPFPFFDWGHFTYLPFCTYIVPLQIGGSLDICAFARTFEGATGARWDR